MKAKSAIHGARAAAGQGEAAKTAANSRSTQASKQASAHAANVVRNLHFLGGYRHMAIYTKCLPCDSRVTDICGKVYHARGKKPPCANAVVENVNSLQQLKAEIASLATELQDFNDRRVAAFGRVTEIVAKMRQLSAV